MENFIQVNNFRKYIETPEIGLNDYNFFVGTNSSGKSSIVKAYMLITKYIKLGRFYDIDFTSPEYQDLNIQDFNRLKCKFSSETDNICITLGLNNFLFELILIPHEKSNYAKVLAYNIYDKQNDIIYEYQYTKGRTSKDFFGVDKTGNPIFKEYSNEEHFKLRLINNDKYKEAVISIINYLIDKEEKDNKVKLGFLNKDLNIIEEAIDFDDIELSNNIGYISTGYVKDGIQDVLNNITRKLNPTTIDSLTKYTPTPESVLAYYRVLNLNNKSTDPNSQSFSEFFGESDNIKLPLGMELATKPKQLFETTDKINSIFLPLTFKKYTNLNSILDKSNDLAQLVHNYYNSKGFKKEIADNFIKHWLSKDQFNIGDDFEINFYGGEAYEILILENGVKIPLIDKGTGNIQIFKILLIIATQIRNQNISTIILEEPELNLHPSLQSKLADLIVSVNTFYEENEFGKRNFNFIVETHSEYLIRRLQVLVIQNKVSKNRLGITYFPSEINLDPYHIQIQEDGSLDKNFGSGFLDEAGNHTLELIRFKRLSEN